MGDTITLSDVRAAMERAADRLIELRAHLTELDAAVGDGDLGINMAKGGAALKQYLSSSEPGTDLGKFIAGAGMAFNRAAPSTMGTLIATALMRAGREAGGLSELDGQRLAQLLCVADAGMQERGKSQPGDKTILDALHPAAVSFSEAIEGGAELKAAAERMLEAARAGRDAAIPLRSKVGRASWVGERTKGKPDPGTVLLVQVLEAILGTEYTEQGSTQG